MTLEPLRSALGRPVAYRRSFVLDLGRLAIFLFGVEVVTGALLALYYRPDTATAYESVGTIMSRASLGWLVRGLHHVTGHALVVVVGLYLARAFFLRTFLRPNGAAAWGLGVAFAALTIAFLLTGSVLPWDQTAYWRTQITFRLVEQIPLVGRGLATAFRGGADVGGVTLVRLFALHALVFPWLAFGCILLARRLRNRGGIR